MFYFEISWFNSRCYAFVFWNNFLNLLYRYQIQFIPFSRRAFLLYFIGYKLSQLFESCFLLKILWNLIIIKQTGNLLITSRKFLMLIRWLAPINFLKIYYLNSKVLILMMSNNWLKFTWINSFTLSNHSDIFFLVFIFWNDHISWGMMFFIAH